jgi:predicted DNA-binding transcriptional regulator AlpA
MALGKRITDRVLNPGEVAALLNIKVGTLYSHLSRGNDLPPSFKVGSQSRWRESEVWRWIGRREKIRKQKNFED